MYVKKFTSFCQVLKKDAHTRKLVPFSVIVIYVTTVPCNLLLVACFLTLMFHKVVWQHMQGVVGFLITILLQIY